MKLFEVTYKVTAVIAAEDYGQASTLAIEEFRQIVNDNDYDEKEVSQYKGNWRDDYIPYGDNRMNLTIDQIGK